MRRLLKRLMRRYRSNLGIGVSALVVIVGLLLSAFIGSNTPLMLAFITFCIVMLVGIVLEWIEVNRPVPFPRKPRKIFILLIGSYPYVAGFVFVSVLLYFMLKLLAGYTINPTDSRIGGRIAFTAAVSVFVLTYFLLFLILVVRLIRRRQQSHETIEVKK
jgi:hypothetical protein